MELITYRLLFLWGIYALLDPDPDCESGYGYGSRGPHWIRIRIHNTVFSLLKCKQMLVLSGAGWARGGGGERGRGRELATVGGQQRCRRHLSQEEEKGRESLQVSSHFSLDFPIWDIMMRISLRKLRSDSFYEFQHVLLNERCVLTAPEAILFAFYNFVDLIRIRSVYFYQALRYGMRWEVSEEIFEYFLALIENMALVRCLMNRWFCIQQLSRTTSFFTEQRNLQVARW